MNHVWLLLAKEGPQLLLQRAPDAALHKREWAKARPGIGAYCCEAGRIGGNQCHVETTRIKLQQYLDCDLGTTTLAIAGQLHHAYPSHRVPLSVVVATASGRTAGNEMLSWNLVAVFHGEVTR